uniref:BESS domain-containing protein n=1 Tax=Heterorhabditis bacteriophora TaxID=37862 RepID=A0A1I7WX56_HETBA
MITSPSVQQQFPQFLKEATQQIYPFPAKPADIAQPSFLYNLPKQLEQPSRVTAITASLPTTHGHANTTPERKHRKQQNDDYVKLIREQDLSEGRIARIPIPVSQALSIDPNFRAVSEQQIVQQIVQNKRYEDMDVRESMTQLCKKLAEKRVFGSKLMAETTVAGLNHSTFPNLPIEGIMYIQLRHAKKTKTQVLHLFSYIIYMEKFNFKFLIWIFSVRDNWAEITNMIDSKSIYSLNGGMTEIMNVVAEVEKTSDVS